MNVFKIPKGRKPRTNMNGQRPDGRDDVESPSSELTPSDELSVWMLNISGSREIKSPIRTIPVQTSRARLTPV